MTSIVKSWRRINLFVAVASLSACATPSSGQMFVIYDAARGTLPTQQCFALATRGTQPTGAAAPTVIDDFLHIGPTTSDCQLVYSRSDFPLDFADGVTFGIEMKVLASGYASTTPDQVIRAGFGVYVLDRAGHAYELWLGSSMICFANNFYEVSGQPGVRELAFDTTDGFHRYEIRAHGGDATLFIDGVARLSISGYGPLYSGSPNGLWAWGDETNHDWANSEVEIRSAWCSGEVCTADFNCDGLVDFSDYLEFLNLYEASDHRADLNADGMVDFADYLEFLNHYDAGC
ncbi:MAG: hypothetical protein IT436_15835 [Phycisphaerales bacterium]|nr:hypothetical protein [Phycisphaerales bacterium]